MENMKEKENKKYKTETKMNGNIAKRKNTD